MGVLNVTPDSFHDGGRFDDAARAVRQGLDLVSEGADIIDIGGESTRPGAERVAPGEQIRRTAGVISGLRARSDVAISIDTTLAPVALAALEAGADIINDVSAGEDDPELFEVASQHRAGLILMHRSRLPKEDVWSDQYVHEPDFGPEGVVQAVRTHLSERVGAAKHAGVPEQAIVVDPGLGFGKSVEQNLALLGGLPHLVADGRPVLIGASRKSFVGAICGGAGPEDRLPGSLAVATLAARLGAGVVRAHDVRETAEVLAIVKAARKFFPGG
jgi:dihydropteroate synthase